MSLLARYQEVRARTEALAAPLSPEDQTLQSMPSASPTKWHRAHTTWFFETFVLAPRGVPAFDPRFAYLFNSYYEAIGPRHARPKRGMLSRPSCAEIAAYRADVDAKMGRILDDPSVRELVTLGLNHEEQHQELLLTDALHALSENPMLPAYRSSRPREPGGVARALRFDSFEGGLIELGNPGGGFAFDNEGPRHKRWIEPFSLSDRLITVGEMRAFIADKGYATPSLWLAEGWDFVRAQQIEAPLYARVEEGRYRVFGLDGEHEAPDDQPLRHVSFYEADAIARWMSARLPTEAEWEHAASRHEVRGNFVDSGALEPRAARDTQMYGDVWQWTRSSYEPYPGYQPAPGALGEYNGKFMVGQIVLRGGSCLTPPGHVRASYRNFWPPDTRFQMTGLRLAR